MARKPTFEDAKRVCVHFPNEDIVTMDEHAEKKGTTRSDLIRGAVNNILPDKENRSKKPEPESKEDDEE